MFGLYIHVPFCVKKCNYCDFNSFKVDRISKNTYLEDLKKEMELYKSEIDENEETDNTQTNEVSKIETVNEVNVSISNEVTSTETKKEKDSLSTSDKKKIKEYLSSVYEIQEKNIVFE